MRLDYIKNVIKPDCVYSIPIDREEVNEAGDTITTTDLNFFLVLTVFQGSAKPKTVPTVFTDGNAQSTQDSAASASIHFLQYGAKKLKTILRVATTQIP